MRSAWRRARSRIKLKFTPTCANSEFNEIIDSINALNADVTSIEAARSHMELLADIPESYVSGLGPGVWDIHSPRVPSQSEVEELIRAAIGVRNHL